MSLQHRKLLVAGDEARAATSQHHRPCSDCPWRRDSLPGWLNDKPPQWWTDRAHGEDKILCHVHLGAQCAGAAVYRRNAAKQCRDQEILKLPPDHEAVFSNRAQFVEHHSRPAILNETTQPMSEHPQLEQAKEAINEVFGDTSVSKEETLAALDDLIDHIEIRKALLHDELDAED